MHEVIRSEQSEGEGLRDGGGGGGLFLVSELWGIVPFEGIGGKREADLTDPFFLDLLPDVVQPALELVDFADCASDDCVEKGVVDGHVGVQAVVRGLEVDGLLEELAGKRGRVESIRSMDHRLPWSSIRCRCIGRGGRGSEDETVRERPVGSEFEHSLVSQLGRPFLISLGGHVRFPLVACNAVYASPVGLLSSQASDLSFRVKSSRVEHRVSRALAADHKGRHGHCRGYCE